MYREQTVGACGGGILSCTCKQLSIWFSSFTAGEILGFLRCTPPLFSLNGESVEVQRARQLFDHILAFAVNLWLRLHPFYARNGAEMGSGCLQMRGGRNKNGSS